MSECDFRMLYLKLYIKIIFLFCFNIFNNIGELTIGCFQKEIICIKILKQEIKVSNLLA